VIQEDFERQIFQMLKADKDDTQDPYIKGAQATDPVQKRFHDISNEDLNRILAAHVTWLESDGKLGQRANLSRVNLQGANLAAANLRKAKLTGADLMWVNSFGVELQGADLRGANLRESYLEEANLQGAILEGASLREAYLVGARLRGADLTRADLQHTNFRMADLQDAHLVEANLQYANLENAGLMNADLSFANLKRASLNRAEISYANLNNADFRGVTGLARTQLPRVKNLSRAKLGAALKKLLEHRQSEKNPKMPKSSLPVRAAEKKPEQNQHQNDKNSRRQPRRPFSKSVFIGSQDQYCKGLIKDINSFGAFIETTTRFSRQQIIRLEIPGTKIDNSTLIIGEVAHSDQRGIGIKFKKLIKQSKFSQDMGGKRCGTDRRKLLFSEYYPEKRKGADRRGGVDRRKLKYFKYYKYGLQLNRIIDNGGRRFTRDRRRQSFGLYWPENRKGSDRRSGQDRRTAFITKKAVVAPETQKRIGG
jgi:uncharacterized protein YjbI with pentapeptide repeats